MPAMRRNDRRGPGIMNCDEAGSFPSSAGEMGTVADCVASGAGRRSPVPANKSQRNRENAIVADKRSGDFTAGFLSEPARRHSTWNLRGRQAMSSIRETEMPSNPRLMSIEPARDFDVGKILHLGRLSKLFFFFS